MPWLKIDRLDVLKELSRRLNGKCNAHHCPMKIAAEQPPSETNYVSIWLCHNCDEMFVELEKRRHTRNNRECPCHRYGEEAIIRLNEYIQELEEEITNDSNRTSYISSYSFD